MLAGNIPRDQGNFVISLEDRKSIIDQYPDAAQLFKKIVGSFELINGVEQTAFGSMIARMRSHHPFRRLHFDWTLSADTVRPAAKEANLGLLHLTNLSAPSPVMSRKLLCLAYSPNEGHM